jgi:hypothetical protein
MRGWTAPQEKYTKEAMAARESDTVPLQLWLLCITTNLGIKLMS